MNLEKLRLRHFTGIKKGLGLDEITIDFSGKTGLVALDGDNGKGKTTVLDNLHPYPELASRPGSLYQHTYSREAEKELSFSFNGDHYRTLIKIDSQSERSEGYIWKNGNPEVNGKISAYSKYINGLFGSSTLFFASVFSAQNAEKMSAMRVGELKELFAEFLRLERYEKWADTSKQIANIYQGRAGDKDGRIKALESTIAEWSNLPELMVIAQDNLDDSARRMGSIRSELSMKRAEVDTLKETITRNALALERRKDLQAQIDRLEGELAKEKTSAEKEISDLSLKYLGIKDAIRQVDAVLKDKAAVEAAAGHKATLEDQAAKLQAGLDQDNQELPGHQQKVADKQAVIVSLKQRLKDLEDDQELREIKGKITEGEAELAGKSREANALEADPELTSLRHQLASLTTAAQVGDGIDATCQSVSCSAIKAVNEAKAKLPGADQAVRYREEQLAGVMILAENQLADMRLALTVLETKRNSRMIKIDGEKTVLQDQIKTADHCLRNLQQAVISTTELITFKRQEIAKIRRGIELQKVLADKLPDMRVAEQRKADLEKQFDEVTKAGTARKEAWEAKQGEVKDQIIELFFACNDIKIFNEAEATLNTVLQEITEIETTKIPAIEKEIQAARDKIALLQAELTKIEAAETELEQVRDQRDLLLRNASEWRYLQGVCGKNGIQAIEIAGSAPLICQYANDILSQAFGPLFQIELLTRDDEGRECLTINVIDEDGETAPLNKKSGGEMVWCLMALRLGMTLLSKEKSERRFETFFSDEIDGALSVEKAEQFINMYRAFMAVGGFKAAVFISHKPNCRAMADHVLSFKEGKNPAWT